MRLVLAQHQAKDNARALQIVSYEYRQKNPHQNTSKLTLAEYWKDKTNENQSMDYIQQINTVNQEKSGQVRKGIWKIVTLSSLKQKCNRNTQKARTEGHPFTNETHPQKASG